MEMSVDEIVRRYSKADDKKKQISILAELNACKYNDIVKVLSYAGLDVKPLGRQKKAEPKKEENKMLRVEPKEFTKVDDDMMKSITGTEDELTPAIEPVEEQKWFPPIPPDAVVKMIEDRIGFIDDRMERIEAEYKKLGIEKKQIEDWWSEVCADE